MQISLTSPND
jgi:hypothetical protein